MACRLFSAKPSPMSHCQLGTRKRISAKFQLKWKHFFQRKQLKIESRLEANFAASGGAVGYNDNLRWLKWWQNWHHDNSRFAMLKEKTIENIAWKVVTIKHQAVSTVLIKYSVYWFHTKLLHLLWTLLDNKIKHRKKKMVHFFSKRPLIVLRTVKKNHLPNNTGN